MLKSGPGTREVGGQIRQRPMGTWVVGWLENRKDLERWRRERKEADLARKDKNKREEMDRRQGLN